MKWRIVAACAVAISGALFGRSLTAAQHRRCRMVDELIDALGRLRVSIVDGLVPLKTALSSCGTELFEKMAAEIRNDVGASEAWKIVRNNTTGHGEIADCLGSAELHVLEILFEHLGRTGGCGQELAIRNCQSALEEIRTKEKKRLGEVSCLYTKLGMLLGFAAAILIL